MIVFNIHAVIVGIILFIVLGILSWIMPDYLVESDLGIIILVLVGTVIAGITEAMGIKGRLFWLPMWLIGVIASLVLIFMEYSWLGLGALAGGIIGVVVLLLGISYAVENKEWNNAPRAFNEVQRINNPEEKEYWQALKEALFIPALKNYTHEMCAHNLLVLDTMNRNGINFDELATFRVKTEEGAIRGNKINIESTDTDPITEYLDEKLKSFEEEEA